MKNVNVTVLRRNLTTWLARIREGERVRVTSRGKVVAEIGPAVPSAGEIAAARARLRGSVRRYDKPFEPAISPREWELNR